MSGFIVKAACRGRRPSHLVGVSGFKRPHLTAHLLKDRSVARVVSAPDGYGKSRVAMEYAETVFAWLHVFWVNCLSPCFVRDLDAHTIARDCAEVDPDVRLVVFDGLPALDDDRAASLSAEIDALLAADCEVLVTCAPTCDVLGQLQPDQHRLAARDLLLSDDELDVTRDVADRLQEPSAKIPPSGRVPGFVWEASEEKTRKLLRASFRRDMPADMRLAIVSLFMIRAGELSDLYSVGTFDLGYVVEMLRDYPHFAIDEDSGEFIAPSMDVNTLLFALSGLMDDLVGQSNLESRQELVRVWADILLSHGSAARACDVVRVLGETRFREAWLAKHAREIVDAGCFYPTLKLARGLRRRRQASAPAMRALVALVEAFCLHVLGDEPAAVSCARRTAKRNAVGEARIGALILLARYGEAEDLEYASAVLAKLADGVDQAGLAGLSFWECLALGWTRLEHDGLPALAELWTRLREAGAEDATLQALAALAFGSAFRGDMRSSVAAAAGGLTALEGYARSCADEGAETRMGYFALSALLAMEQAHGRGMGYAEGPLPTRVLLAMRQGEMAVMAQRQEYERDEGADEARRADWMATHPDTLAAITTPAVPATVQRSAPILTVRVFGRFEVAIGGVPVGGRLFRLQPARTLVALLVAHRGREIQRDALGASLWPGSAPDTARKNFYSLWSKLRRALTLPDGTCPYLVRHQLGCRLETSLVESDFARLDEICREFLFGRVELQLWSALFAEVESNFMDDLLPTDGSNALIAAKRDESRSRLVDALVAAAAKLAEVGNSQWGIWFARAGVDRDPAREDAYLALMRAQVASGQRTSAIMTYHQCRRALADRLGVDPSAEIEELYRSLID